MNKTELIEHIAKHADISKAAATRALESTIGAVKTTLKKGGSVSLVGFGTFAVGKRAARTGRNPRTGAAIKIYTYTTISGESVLVHQATHRPPFDSRSQPFGFTGFNYVYEPSKGSELQYWCEYRQ